MRVGLVLDHYDPGRGGVEQWTSQYVDWLLANGDTVEIIAAGFAGDLTQPIVRHHVPARQSRLAWAADAERTLRNLSLDIVHDMGAGWYCDVLQPHGGCRKAWFEQSLKMLPAWQRPMKRLAARCLPRYREFSDLSRRQAGGEHIVLALSQMTYNHLEQLDGVPGNRLQLVYNGVDVERFSLENCEPHRDVTRSQLGLSEKTVFLIVAHNLKLKGLPTLLPALSRVAASESNVHLLVVGGGRVSGFQRQVQQLGLAGHVTFVGAVDDPRPYYAAADVYVQPSRYDCCSLVVLEALACGLPVITTAHNGAGELLTPGQTGFVIDDPFDSDSLAASMSVLLDDTTRAEMSVRARQLAEHHRFERNCAEIRNVYENVLAARRESAAA